MHSVKHIVSAVALCIVLALQSCTSETPLPDSQSLAVRFEVECNGYSDGATRADKGWSNGDCIFAIFANDNKRVLGKITYSASDNLWTLNYDGQMKNGTGSCSLFYLENARSLSTGLLSLDEHSCVYSDLAATYTKASDGVSIRGILSPATGRLKLKSAFDINLSLDGFEYITDFSLTDYSFSTSSNTLAVNISANQSSEYIYGSFSTSRRELSISYIGYKFTRAFDSQVLQAAHSGYLDVPTESVHNGWDMTKYETPFVSGLTLSALGADYVSLLAKVESTGNLPIVECGFCYRPALNSTQSETVVKSSLYSQGLFESTISGLNENTVYSVRAYAQNQFGTFYTEPITFTTDKRIGIDKSEYGDDENWN